MASLHNESGTATFQRYLCGIHSSGDAPMMLARMNQCAMLEGFLEQSLRYPSAASVFAQPNLALSPHSLSSFNTGNNRRILLEDSWRVLDDSWESLWDVGYSERFSRGSLRIWPPPFFYNIIYDIFLPLFLSKILSACLIDSSWILGQHNWKEKKENLGGWEKKKTTMKKKKKKKEGKKRQTRGEKWETSFMILLRFLVDSRG